MLELFHCEQMGKRMAIAVAPCLTQFQKRTQARTFMNCFKSHTQTQISRCYCKLSNASLSCTFLYFVTFLSLFYSLSPHPHLEDLLLGLWIRIHLSIQKYISTSYYIPVFSHLMFSTIFYIFFPCCYVLYCFLVFAPCSHLSCLSNLYTQFSYSKHLVHYTIQ